jgi:adenylate kinase family enzyme
MKKNEILTLSKEFKKNNLRRKKNKGKKRAIIFVGIRGSGKTTLSKKLEENSSFVKVSTDDIKRFLIKKRIQFGIRDLFFIQRMIFEKFAEREIDIISDSNTDKEKYREELIKFLRKRDYKYIIIYLPIKKKEALKRVTRRDKARNPKIVLKKIERDLRNLDIPKGSIILKSEKSKKIFLERINSVYFN